MAPIIALSVAIILGCVLFPEEISKRDLSPLVLFLLVMGIVMLTDNNGKTLELGPLLWRSLWLPQMLGIVIVFLLFVVPGPKILAMLREKGQTAHQALSTTVIGVLVCVLLGLITMTVSAYSSFL